MSNSTCTTPLATSIRAETAEQDLRELVEQDLQGVVAAVLRFRTKPITPTSMAAFEQDLKAVGDEMTRRIVKALSHHLEPVE